MTLGSPRLRALFLTLLLAVGPAWAEKETSLAPALVQRAKAATVLVDLGKHGSGSGFLVHPSGFFVTARHVVEAIPQHGEMKLVLHSGESGQKSIPARVAMVFEDVDLALIKADGPFDALPLPLAGEAGLQELAPVVEFGYPFGKLIAGDANSTPAISINAGRISSLRRDGTHLEMIQLDAAANPGNSGGPVLNKKGEVIGVLVSGQGENLNFAIPVSKVIAALRQPMAALRAPTIDFAHRGDLVDFTIEAFSAVPIPAGAKLSVKFGEKSEKGRTFSPELRDGLYRFRAAPYESKEAKPLRLRMQAVFGATNVTTNLDDAHVKVGGREMLLSEVRSMVRQKNEREDRGRDRDDKRQEWKTSLTHFDLEREVRETINEPIVGLPMLHSTINDVTLDPAHADEIRLGVYDPHPIELPYELTLSAGGEPLFSTRGHLDFDNPPAWLSADDDNGEGSDFIFFRFARRGGSNDRIDGLIDPANDARQGTWTRTGDTLETAAEPSAWCDIPVLPRGSYELTFSFKPKETGQGELLLQLPIGEKIALLHIAGSPKGVSKVDLIAAKSADQQGEGKGLNFVKDRPLEVTVSVFAREEYAAIFVRSKEDRALLRWSGKTKYLLPPAGVPEKLTPLAIGHRDLAMTIQSIAIEPTQGMIRITREIPPGADRDDDYVVGYWKFDEAPTGEKLLSDGYRNFSATIQGSPEIGKVPGLFGGKAMSLPGQSKSGFVVAEGYYSNQGSIPNRTISFWFRASNPSLSDRQYLYDEGGNLKGYAVYIKDGLLHGGGWDVKNKWPGTWFKSGPLEANRWYHVAFRWKVAQKKTENGLQLYLDGKLVGQGLAKLLNGHEPIAFGHVHISTLSADGPSGAKNHPFEGLMDEVEIYNLALGPDELNVLAAGRFKVDPPK